MRVNGLADVAADVTAEFFRQYPSVTMVLNGQPTPLDKETLARRMHTLQPRACGLWVEHREHTTRWIIGFVATTEQMAHSKVAEAYGRIGRTVTIDEAQHGERCGAMILDHQEWLVDRNPPELCIDGCSCR